MTTGSDLKGLLERLTHKARVEGLVVYVYR